VKDNVQGEVSTSPQNDRYYAGYTEQGRSKKERSRRKEAHDVKGVENGETVLILGCRQLQVRLETEDYTSRNM
jgi:hypothetical protein